MELEKTSPKFHQKSDLGGSWALFWEGLGRSWASFGHFWALLGCFFGVLESTFFKHVPAWAQDGLQEASGIDLGSILGRFWEGLKRKFNLNFGNVLVHVGNWFWTCTWACMWRFFTCFRTLCSSLLCQDPRAVLRSVSICSHTKIRKIQNGRYQRRPVSVHRL